MEKDYNPFKSYQRSKVCNVLFTRALAKRLQGTQVTVNALHPGVIMTDAGRYIQEAYKIPGFIFQLILAFTFPIRLWTFKSINQGAQTQIYCAVSEDLEGVSGLYFRDCKQLPYLKMVLDDQLTEKVFKLSESLTNCKYD